jgi:methyltransferase (TIGR00027 family)
VKSGEPSRTALGAASHRAAHQALEGGAIFHDPLALRILGADADAAVEEARRDPDKRWMRRFIALRTRFAEDAIGQAYAGGVRQVVVLGAGLDTYAYRATLPAGARVFELDHPATQAWKRERLASAAIEVPDAVSFVPIDFERDRLADRLQAASFDPARPSFFTWLGVVPYLPEGTVFATLGVLANMSGGVEVVFDYAATARATDDPRRRALRESLEARVAAQGEPFRSHFDPERLARELRALGFPLVDDLMSSDLAARYVVDSGDKRSGVGGHVLRAATGSAPWASRRGASLSV